MVNLVVLQGRLTKDLELKFSPIANRKYCNNSIAIDKGKNKEGNKRDATFINFTVWENNAEYLVKYAKKGGQVIIEGRLEQRKEYNYEKNINEYELYVVPTNITIIDFKEKQITENTTTQKVNENTVGYSAISSIKSNEIIEDEDYEQMGFNAEDDDFINSLPF